MLMKNAMLNARLPLPSTSRSCRRVMLNIIPPHNTAKPANTRFTGTLNFVSCGVVSRNGTMREYKKEKFIAKNAAIAHAKSTVAAGLVGSENRDIEAAFRPQAGTVNIPTTTALC
jgi:hypothetical protein